MVGVSLGVQSWYVIQERKENLQLICLLHLDCVVAPFTGDNPATVIALSTPGDAILSLGTSTTFLLSIPPTETTPKCFTSSHLLAHPTTYDAHIAMLCYKNGALAREQVRNRYGDGHWSRFNELVEESPIGNNGIFGFYFPLPEIIPPNVIGNSFFALSDDQEVIQMDEDDIPASVHPRAILESQFLSIRSRVAAILPEHSPPLQRLILSGGSSANPVIRQLAADIFGMQVFVAGQEGAAEGGALLARYAWWREQNGGKGTFEEMRAFDGEWERMKRVAEPCKEHQELYNMLIEPYRKCEAMVVSLCEGSSSRV